MSGSAVAVAGSPAALMAAAEVEPPFLGQCLLQRVQGVSGHRQPSRFLVCPHDRGVHADQFQTDLPRAAASAINTSIRDWNTPALAQPLNRE